MSLLKDIKESFITQILELEALQSVYPKEVVISDYGNLADINNFIDGNQIKIPQRLEYNIEISFLKGIIELFVNLPLNYPHTNPEVYCRSSFLDRNNQLKLNKDLISFSTSQEKGEPIVYSLISWIRDNTEVYLKDIYVKENKEESVDINNIYSIFSRYWIYSHHIYSKIKRKDIVNLAKNCSLTGFSFIGKPGIICVEGSVDDCEYFWQEIKAMNWHRIVIKFTENFTCISDINIYKKFDNFQEICFLSSERHNDTGQLLKYLIEHELEHAFKKLFGLESE